MRSRRPNNLVCAFIILVGCSGTDPGSAPVYSSADAGSDVTVAPDAAGGSDGSAGSGGALIDPEAGQKDHFEPPFCPNPDPSADEDGDGYTVEQGDCNDCTPYLNPGAYDLPDGVDEDCNGVIDDFVNGCDDAIAENDDDAMNAARAIGLCPAATQADAGAAKTWGVLSARYVFPDGSTASKSPKTWQDCQGQGGEGKPPNPLSHGILPNFGVEQPRQGSALLALSSGIARSGVNGPSPGGAFMCTRSGMPPGFPTPSTNCPNQDVDPGTSAYDGIALEITLRVPTNALAFTYDFNFYAFEFPDWVCKQYNDYFVALLLPSHPGAGPNNNISFDSANNPVSVNNALLEACSPGTYNGKPFACPLGTAGLKGTGFDGHGATGWLQTTVSVTPGEELTLRFAIWDSVDESADATVLIDNFRWALEEMKPGTVRPPK
jgi:hypothetical protein